MGVDSIQAQPTNLDTEAWWNAYVGRPAILNRARISKGKDHSE